MKGKILQRVELATNLAIIITALLLCTVLVKKYLLSPAPSVADNVVPAKKSVQVGEKLSIQGVDWEKNGQTLILALSTTCHYCSESAPFYQQLIQKRGGVRVVAVVPQNIDAGRQYLQKLGVHVDEVKQLTLESIKVRGTPTLLLVNGNGVVTNEWAGKLPAEQEAEVIQRLQASRAGV